MSKVNQKPVFLQVTYDEERCGYFVKGHGFDFFAYFTEDAIECCSVTRKDDDYILHLSIELRGLKRLSCDILETLIARELATVWVIA